jgi:hypothetical protein
LLSLLKDSTPASARESEMTMADESERNFFISQRCQFVRANNS